MSSEQMVESLYQIGMRNGTDKFYHHRYDRFYPRYLEPFRDKPFTMCEIGVQDGASINTWHEYFPQAKIFGVDINPPDKKIERVDFIKANQGIDSDLEMVASKIGMCKFIIDDGSHNPDHQLKTFFILAKNCLDYGGVYIIEDIETSYWKRVGTNFIKNITPIIDTINGEFSRRHNYLDFESVTFAHNCVIVVRSSLENKDLLKRKYRFGKKLKK